MTRPGLRYNLGDSQMIVNTGSLWLAHWKLWKGNPPWQIICMETWLRLGHASQDLKESSPKPSSLSSLAFGHSSIFSEITARSVTCDMLQLSLAYSSLVSCPTAPNWRPFHSVYVYHGLLPLLLAFRCLDCLKSNPWLYQSLLFSFSLPLRGWFLFQSTLA